MASLKVYRKNTRTINLSFPGVDLTNATVYFTVKKEFDSVADGSSALIMKDVTTHTDPTNGKTSIELTSSDTDVETGKWVYDIKLKKSGGEEYTLEVGKCIIQEVVTLRG